MRRSSTEPNSARAEGSSDRAARRRACTYPTPLERAKAAFGTRSITNDGVECLSQVVGGTLCEAEPIVGAGEANQFSGRAETLEDPAHAAARRCDSAQPWS